MREAEPELSLAANGIIDIAEAGMRSDRRLRNSGESVSLPVLYLAEGN